MPAVFWVPVAAGMVGLPVGTGAWGLRTTELRATLLDMARAGVVVSSVPAKVSSKGEIALPGGQLHGLMAVTTRSSIREKQ